MVEKTNCQAWPNHDERSRQAGGPHPPGGRSQPHLSGVMPGEYDPLRYGPSSLLAAAEPLLFPIPQRVADAPEYENGSGSRDRDIMEYERNASRRWSLVGGGRWNIGGGGQGRMSSRPSVVPTRSKVRVGSSRRLGGRGVSGADKSGHSDSDRTAASRSDASLIQGRCLKGKSQTRQGGMLPPPHPPPPPPPPPLPRKRPLLRQRRPPGRIVNTSSSSGGGGKGSAMRGACLHNDTAPMSPRRSPSWHHRERLNAGKSCESSRDTSLVVDGPFARRRSRVRGSKNGPNEKQAGLSGESIDAEELFRRKKKFTYHVTFGGWAERYDKNKAERASLKRREYVEMAREVDLKRQRAAEEFQKWLWNRGRAAAQKENDGDRKRRDCAAGPITGRSAERSAERVPRPPPPAVKTRAASERFNDKANRIRDSNGSNIVNSYNTTTRTKEEAEGRQSKVDRAFRKWLDRKRKQAESDRESQKRKEELAEERKYERLLNARGFPPVEEASGGVRLHVWCEGRGTPVEPTTARK